MVGTGFEPLPLSRNRPTRTNDDEVDRAIPRFGYRRSVYHLKRITKVSMAATRADLVHNSTSCYGMSNMSLVIGLRF